MWTRSELKARAKQSLKGHYWTAFLAALVLAFFVEGGSGSAGAGGAGSSLENVSPELMVGVVILVCIISLLTLAFAVFVSHVLQVGGCRYFTSACCRDYSLSNLGFGFKQGRYWNIVKTQLLCTIRILLWGLLFVIPGIVKAYAYYMVPYILADNPHISPKRALELSNRMTMGHKGGIFVLELSFIGWYLLGTLCCGIGVLFVEPYRHATMAELYMQLRHEALQRGDVTLEELCLSAN